MARITLSVSERFLAQLQKNAAGKAISLAQYVRELIDVGFKIEATGEMENQSQSQNKPQAMNSSDTTHDTVLWKNDLIWSLECRYLLRYLVDNMLHDHAEKRDAALSLAKEKAQRFVEELLAERL